MQPSATQPRPLRGQADALAALGRPLTPGEADAAGPALPSSVLLQGRKTVQIEHNGAVYQLRATKFGKLILTK